MAGSARGALLACAFLLIACSASATDGPLAIQTQRSDPGACLLLPVDGVLVADSTWGLALMGSDDAGNPHRYGVIWPHGYSARREQGTPVLIDRAGKVVAREGDRLELDGMLHDPLTPCPGIIGLGPN